MQLMGGKLHEQALEAIEVGFGVCISNLELLSYLIVEVFEQLPARAGHRLVYLKAQIELKLVEGSLDFVGFPAALVDGHNSLLEIDTGFDDAKDFIASPENALKELEFFGQKLKHPLVGGVGSVQKVDHYNIMLLAVAVAAANSLLDTLRIPGEVIVYNKRAKLKVNAFCAGFGGDHDAALLAKVIHEGRSHIGST
jgi:hypothetical protein